MSVYLGYQTFVRHNGKVILLPLDHPGFFEALKGIDTIAIGVDESLSDCERAKTVIHEFIHLGIEGDPFLVDCMNNDFSRMNEREFKQYEGRVEKLAHDVYNCQPRFVEHIMNRFLTKR